MQSVFGIARSTKLTPIAGLFFLCSLAAQEGQSPDGFVRDIPSLAETPLVMEDTPLLESAVRKRHWLDAAERARNLGLDLAAGLYRRALELEGLTDAERLRVRLDLAASLINRGEFEAADEVLTEIRMEAEGAPDGSASELALMQALVEFGIGDFSTAIAALNRVRADDLEARFEPWFFLATGLGEESRGNLQSAEAWFIQARERADTFQVRATMELAIQRNRLLRAESGAGLIQDLEKALADNQYSRLAAQYASALAIALDRSERKNEALNLLRNQIRLTLPENEDQLGDLFLLVAMIAESGTEDREASFQWLLSNLVERRLQEIALKQLILEAENAEDRETLEAFLGSLVSQPSEGANPERHQLEAEILFALAVLADRSGGQERAEAYLNRLQSEFPGSTYAIEALRFLAILAQQQGALRTAADFFGQLRERLAPGQERILAGVYQADSFFLSGDYATAAAAYGAVDAGSLPPELRDQVLYQRVLALIRTGNLEVASNILDSRPLDLENRSLFRWQAEWNLAYQLRRDGQSEVAYQRVSSLLASETAATLEPGLLLRLAWLQSLLAYDTRRYREAADQADSLADLMEAADLSVLDAEGLSPVEVDSRRLFLKGRALLSLGRAGEEGGGLNSAAEEGLAVFETLRETYPEVPASQLSLFEEARFLVGVGRAIDAQQRYLQLAETPDSPFAPVALYEAAINAANLIALENPESLDLENSKPVVLLRKLTEEYGANRELLFYARLKQGDIARDLGRFGIARGIYENLISQFPDHPERYLPEMARADAILAQSADNPVLRSEAITAYERLAVRPDIPADLQVEASNKLAFILNRSGNPDRARELYFLTINGFLLKPGMAEQLGVTGRYWMSRSILELAEILEESGKLASAAELYQSLLDYDLPGRNLARSSLERLGRLQTAAVIP